MQFQSLRGCCLITQYMKGSKTDVSRHMYVIIDKVSDIIQEMTMHNTKLISVDLARNMFVIILNTGLLLLWNGMSL